ncbi:ABC transporter ATP-binding protein [Candidatus Hikarchaeum yamanae]|uniref:ABC transporter ATP-binding protein n=1 Tax=Candidatus Hikarchaeum yamanae TaxID=2675326 RepID=UPI0039EA3451
MDNSKSFDVWPPLRGEGPKNPILEIENMFKNFGKNRILSNLSFSVGKGELLTLLGASGSGKTTILRCIAGLQEIDGGTIKIHDELVSSPEVLVPPEKRGVGIVFQNLALFPHLTVSQNVSFGINKYDLELYPEKVDDLLELVGLSHKKDCYPNELSGGQKQRIALARSLAPNPSILLLDEPFSSIDAGLRIEMREELRTILKTTGTTTIFVTHDQEEALSISDRVLILKNGRIEQSGSPQELFNYPRSRFVASFLGHASFISGFLDGDTISTMVGDINRENIYGLSKEYDNLNMEILFRPEDLKIDLCNPKDANGTITYQRYLGEKVLYKVALLNGEIIQCSAPTNSNMPLNSFVCVSIESEGKLAWFPSTHID